jgi:hypothetical protein
MRFQLKEHVRQSASVIAATSVVLACTAFLRIQSSSVELGELAGGPPARGNGYRVLLVFQVRDCESPRPWLRVFDEPGIRERVAVSGVVLGGGVKEGEAAERIEAVYRRIPLRAAGRAGARTLWWLGYRSTPYVIILDSDGRVRLATPAPMSDEQADQLRRAIRHLIATPQRSEAI